jgi:hypothetical protein
MARGLRQGESCGVLEWPAMSVALAFPRFEEDRQRLRKFVSPLPVIYPNSIDAPCIDCGMVLAVGPRTMAILRADPTIPLCCPLCTVKRSGGEGMNTVNLGNPDSAWEK